MKKILITTRTIFGDENMDYIRLAKPYVVAVENANSIPIIASSTINEKIIEEYLSLCDGFIFSGGEDVNPAIYNEDIIKETKSFSNLRDEFEGLLLKKILETNKPILGICRGMQFINAYMGGSLFQDVNISATNLNHNMPNNLRDEVHEINIERDSILYKYFGNNTKVNTFHHQAVKDVAPNFKVTSRANDGIIESMEHLNRYIHLVQFHPEVLNENHKKWQLLFDDLVLNS